MIAYHGSNVEVRSPDVLHSREAVDFGAGFYVTELRDQALKWCERFKRRGEDAYLNAYELDISRFGLLRCLVFESYSREWLELVSRCRLGDDPGGHDVVVGGVANDKVFNTCELFFRGFISAEEALDRLRFEEPSNQYCFKTQEAIDACLCFRGCERI